MYGASLYQLCTGCSKSRRSLFLSFLFFFKFKYNSVFQFRQYWLQRDSCCMVMGNNDIPCRKGLSSIILSFLFPSFCPHHPHTHPGHHQRNHPTHPPTPHQQTHPTHTPPATDPLNPPPSSKKKNSLTTFSLSQLYAFFHGILLQRNNHEGPWRSPGFFEGVWLHQYIRKQ